MELMKNKEPMVNKSANFLLDTTKTGSNAAAKLKQNMPPEMQIRKPMILCFLVMCLRMGSSSACWNREGMEVVPSSLTTPTVLPAMVAADFVWSYEEEGWI